MKNLIIYWVIGCFVVGLPMGQLLTECPNAKVKPADVLATVATWPLVFAMVISRIGKPPFKTACEDFQ